MIDSKTFKRYAEQPEEFRNDLLVDVDGRIEKFGNVMDDWQREDFRSLDPGVKRAIGRSNEPAKTRAYFERGRGHSKTTDIATVCVYNLLFAERPIRGYAFAADRDQSALLRDAMEKIVRMNPWIAEILKVGKNEIENVAEGHKGEGSNLKIYTSDVGSSYGILADFLISDELCHWQENSGSSLWESILSSAAKRSNCLLFVISNSGFVDSWQWKVREAARTDESWIFSRLDGPKASWLSEERLAEQKRMLPASAYARLWENQWSTGLGDALTPTDIEAAFDSTLQPMTGRESEYLFVAGVDLGLKRDCSAIVTLGVPKNGTGRIRLADTKLWKPRKNQKIDLTDVEDYLLELDRKFGLECVGFDPWNCELLAVRLETNGNRRRRNDGRKFGREPWMRELTPTGNNLREIASLTIECFLDRRLGFYPEDRLRADLLKLRVEEKTYGYRLSSPRDSSGHGDMFSAFSLALLVGHDVSRRKVVSVSVLY